MTKKESGTLFLVIAFVLFSGPQWVPLVVDPNVQMTATQARILAVLHLLPGIAVIFLILGIYRLVTKDKSQLPGS
jgi:hypothetical protein